jgi:hypothetical protein
MPPENSNSKALWMIVEAVLAGLMMLTVALLLDLRGSVENHNERLTTIERRVDAGEADEFTASDALEVWRAISDLAKETATVSPAVDREFDGIRRRIELLENRLGSGSLP